MWCTMRVIKMAPDAPRGRPTAMAPPSGLSLAWAAPVSAWGVPAGDGAAERVEPGVVGSCLRLPGEGHARERLVDLEGADVVDRQPRPLEHLRGGGGRRGKTCHGGGSWT